MYTPTLVQFQYTCRSIYTM